MGLSQSLCYMTSVKLITMALKLLPGKSEARMKLSVALFALIDEAVADI